MSVILISGSSTGIGYATAETLARNGHTVYATMRNPQRLSVNVNIQTIKVQYQYTSSDRYFVV